MNDLDIPDFLLVENRTTAAKPCAQRAVVELQSEPLADLATRIKAAHAAVGTALKHALEAGNLLIEAKRLVRHGEWLSWVEEHCEISERTAQAYMQLVDKVGHLFEDDGTADEDKRKAQRVAGLSVRKALRAVSTPKRWVMSKPTTATLDDQDEDDTGPDEGPLTTGINPVEARRHGLLNRAAEAICLARFDDLSGLTVDDPATIKVVREAATAWSSLATRLEKAAANAVDPRQIDLEDLIAGGAA
jgi:hypothetical protein